MKPNLPWPLPALLAWVAGWLLCALLLALPAPPALAFGAALLGTTVLALMCRGTWRRAIVGGGFPLSALALGGASALPAWAWLLPLLPLLALYPLRAWRDAPLFPTPRDALAGLDAVVGQPRCVLDAGCGLGDGLAALRSLWPQARLAGIEWSAPLAWAAAWRCRARAIGAEVRRGDMWAASWAGHDLVYLFQRPESMARAFAKAARELRPEAWLVSLEFAVPGQQPAACLRTPGGKPVWVYRPAAGGALSTEGGSGR